jgi:drug/metabolite transporter (DMT)-like permease
MCKAFQLHGSGFPIPPKSGLSVRMITTARMPNGAAIWLQYTTAINSMLINSLSPLIMVLFTFVWLKEKATWQQLAGLGISLAGVIWIASKGSIDNLLQFNFNPGDLLIFLACIVWTVYYNTSKKSY